tara:strand:+ start:636 stop:779 length:144 start_codon:yes stop_codon:yes gene_type:complete
MIDILLSIIIVTLLGIVASLKTKLNITENNLNSWRQTALDLNNRLNH